MLYDEQQQMIEDELTPAGLFASDEEEVYVEGGDVWTVVGDTKVY